MNSDSQKKYNINEEFKSYQKIVSVLYHNNQSPGYFLDIREYLKDVTIYKQKMIFIEEIIKIIFLLEEE